MKMPQLSGKDAAIGFDGHAAFGRGHLAGSGKWRDCVYLARWR
jgi:hypothetical protein